MEDLLFDRAVKLTLTKPTGFFNQGFNAIEITELRLQFNIEKNLRSEPNKCDIKITNLSRDSQSQFEKKPLHIRLDAGYVGKLKKLFTGDLRWAQSAPDGPNVTTQLQIAEGDRAHRLARVKRSFKGGVTSKDALKEVAKSMGLKVPTNASEAKALLKQYSGGIVLSGSSEKQMTNILKPHGMGWSVQENGLQILDDQATRPGEALVISQDTGMVGFPAFGPPPEKGKKKAPIMKVKSLLYPELVPGGKIKVISERINGIFRVEKVVHTGDTHGNEWYSEVEAKQVA